MREIKFRGKRRDTGEWIYGYLVRGNEGGYYIINSLNEACLNELEPDDIGIYEVIPKTVGQYIGLEDKNGKEIYEGDIVYIKNIYRKGIIKYADGEFYIELYGKGEKYLSFISLFAANFDYYVIGNIHDNSELLGGEIK